MHQIQLLILMLYITSTEILDPLAIHHFYWNSWSPSKSSQWYYQNENTCHCSVCTIKSCTYSYSYRYPQIWVTKTIFVTINLKTYLSLFFFFFLLVFRGKKQSKNLMGFIYQLYINYSDKKKKKLSGVSCHSLKQFERWPPLNSTQENPEPFSLSRKHVNYLVCYIKVWTPRLIWLQIILVTQAYLGLWPNAGKRLAADFIPCTHFMWGTHRLYITSPVLTLCRPLTGCILHPLRSLRAGHSQSVYYIPCARFVPATHRVNRTSPALALCQPHTECILHPCASHSQAMHVKS